MALRFPIQMHAKLFQLEFTLFKAPNSHWNRALQAIQQAVLVINTHLREHQQQRAVKAVL